LKFSQIAMALVGCIWCFSCSRTAAPVEPTPIGDPFSIDAVDYATNYFFVDTSFRALLYSSVTGVGTVPTNGAGISLESVWIELPAGPPDPNQLECKAFLSLPYWRKGRYEDLQNAQDKPGEIESGRFIHLSRDQYSVPMAGFPGIVAIRVPVADDRAIAISCCTNNGFLGEFPWGVSLDSTLQYRKIILKLIKPRNLLATGLPHTAWLHLAKNIYKTGFRNIEHRDFQLKVLYKSPSGSTSTDLFGHGLLRLLGVDLRDENGSLSATGDGAFDYVAGKTIDTEYGEVIFPELEPFARGIQVGLRDNAIFLNDTSAYLIKSLYDTTQAVASGSLRGVYTIAGRAVHY
jgi:hypothetical protein